MAFAHDTDVALTSAAALVNTIDNAEDRLADLAALDAFLTEQRFTGSRTHTADELAAVRRLRPKLRKVWTMGEDEAVALVNSMLSGAKAMPQLIKHDSWDWHLHATTAEAPLATRMEVEAAMALVDAIRSKELDRLRICAAKGCSAVVVDLSRNRSKRFCDTGNCANRTHVAAYRARKAMRP